jgi:amino acid adenylation domain-containing protein
MHNPARVPAALCPNVAWMLWDTADRTPEAPAILEHETITSYADLRGRSAGIAEGLRRAGVGPGDRVGIFLDRGADAAASFFGVAAVGGVAVIINETLKPRQVEHILGHSGARTLVASQQLLRRQPRALDTSAAILDVAHLPAHGDGEPEFRIGQDIAEIIYTSGSTGLPKGVTVTHSNIWAGARAVSDYVQITAQDRIASLLPFSFDYGFNQLLCAVLTGAALVVERSPLPEQIVTSLRAHRVSVLPCVPALWLRLLTAPSFETPLPALRAMTNTGGRLPAAAVRRLREQQPRAKLFLMYGLTEAFRATYLPPELVDEHPDSIGRAIPGSEIMVLREDLTPCDVGEVGELVQRGPTVAAGYWNDPETTNRVYRPNPLRTEGAPTAERVVFSGDLVRRDEKGLLYFMGRRERMIKTLGFRVSPDEVADVVFASGEAAEVLVGTEPDPVRGDQIVAYVVLKPGGRVEALEGYCRVELPRYMQPARFEVCSEIPRTTSGKFDLRALQESLA